MATVDPKDHQSHASSASLVDNDSSKIMGIVKGERDKLNTEALYGEDSLEGTNLTKNVSEDELSGKESKNNENTIESGDNDDCGVGGSRADSNKMTL